MGSSPSKLQGLRMEMGFSKRNQGSIFKGDGIVLQGSKQHRCLLLSPPHLGLIPDLVPSSRSPIMWTWRHMFIIYVHHELLETRGHVSAVILMWGIQASKETFCKGKLDRAQPSAQCWGCDSGFWRSHGVTFSVFLMEVVPSYWYFMALNQTHRPRARWKPAEWKSWQNLFISHFCFWVNFVLCVEAEDILRAPGAVDRPVWIELTPEGPMHACFRSWSHWHFLGSEKFFQCPGF